MENEKMSERVEKEFESWKERFEIPYDKEFQVKTLLRLQEEYDGVKSGSDTTRTRETLLSMIQQLSRELKLKGKPETIKLGDFTPMRRNIIGFNGMNDRNLHISRSNGENIPDVLVQLPEIFKGKDFTVNVFLQDTGKEDYSNCSIKRISVGVLEESIDKDNAQFKVRTRIEKICYLENDVQDTYFTGCSFGYIVTLNI